MTKKTKTKEPKPKTKKESQKITPVASVAVTETSAESKSGDKNYKSKIKETEEKKPQEKSSKEPQTMEELLAQTGYQIKVIKRGDFLEGVVTYIGPKTILIDIGGKTEGVLHEKEWEIVADLIKTLKVGDKVRCYVVLPENEKGQAVLSLKKAAFEFKWQKIEEVKKTGETISVRGKEVNKGGLICETEEGLMGFLPASQMGPSHYGHAKDLINKIVQVKVIEVDRKQNRLIFSEKEVVGLEKKQVTIEDITKRFKIGEVYEGKVTGIVPFGVFVEVDGVSGLVHISEIAWEKVENPGDYFKVGDKIKVMVLGIEEKSGKLNLSVKQLTPDPWQEVSKKYALNQTIKGKISRISPYGAFVTLEPGVEGLIHISKIPPEKELKEEEEVECLIEAIDSKKRRIALTLIMKEKPIGYK